MHAIPFRKRFFTLLLLVVGFIPARAQSPAADSLESKFNRYQAASVQEKLFVHVDKTFYLAGEIVWFKTYAVDARSNTPFSPSDIAYIELLDGDQKAVIQTKVGLNNGSGDGSFRIPLSLPSGHYSFRAYTSWMKNFAPDFYFQQPLTILNTLNASSSIDSIRPETLTIQFFPEGGNLVKGLPSVVAFKATSSLGKGVDCNGVILDQKKDTVARFNSLRSGIGHFLFTPSQGGTYMAIATTGALTSTSALGVYDEGWVMHLNDSDAHRLRITVYASPTKSGDPIYLFVQSHQRIVSVQAAGLAGNVANFSIDTDSLTDGISHFTIFNSDRIPVCERLYCKQPRKRLLIDIKTPSISPETRHKLLLDLSSTDQSGHPTPANLSMSVFLLDSLQSIPEENILSYLLLSSDLKGRIDSPQSYFADSRPETLEALDDLMLTQGWSRFRWEDVLHDQKPVFDFLPEDGGPVIYAKITDKRAGTQPGPTIAYLSVPGRRFKVAAALSKPDGTVFFHLENFYGNKEIILQTNESVDSIYRIDISNPWSDRFPMGPVSGPAGRSGLNGQSSPQWKSQLLNRSIAVQAENAYRPKEKYRVVPIAEKDTTGFYGTSDLSYKLDDYVRFVTMDEVIREYVDNVKVRFTSGKAYLRVKNALFNLFFEDDPLLLIDGVPVFQGDKFISINPLKIERIDVVSHRYYLGPAISDGIVSLRSYEGDLGGYQLDPNAVVVQYNGLQEHREFYTPIYESAAQTQSPVPDLRNQLMWRPDILTDASGKQEVPIYTSDLAGKFAIVLQGLAADGSIGYAVKAFTVTKPQ